MSITGVNRHAKPKSPVVIPKDVAERASTRFTLDPESECFLSTYSVASHGYAQIGWDRAGHRAMTLAHRAAWVHFTEVQIPEGMTIDHVCKTRICVNVAHLRMLSNYENARRTAGRDWPLGQCIKGHDNSELVWTDGGSRAKCRLCKAEWQRTYRAKRRAAA